MRRCSCGDSRPRLSSRAQLDSLLIHGGRPRQFSTLLHQARKPGVEVEPKQAPEGRPIVARHGSAGYKCKKTEQVPKGTAPQESTASPNVQHTSRVGSIAAALKALSERLDMRTV